MYVFNCLVALTEGAGLLFFFSVELHTGKQYERKRVMLVLVLGVLWKYCEWQPSPQQAGIHWSLFVANSDLHLWTNANFLKQTLVYIEILTYIGRAQKTWTFFFFLICSLHIPCMLPMDTKGFSHCSSPVLWKMQCCTCYPFHQN